MNPKLVPLISHPCPQDWNAMTGSDKQRFCQHCQLHVHNLTAMSQVEQETLLSDKGRKCVAYVDSASSIKVSRNTWLLLQRLLKPWRLVFAVVAMWLPQGAAMAASSSRMKMGEAPSKTQHDSAKGVREIYDSKSMYTTGVMAPLEDAWWRRILFFWKR